MLRINLQFFGGRGGGSKAGKRGGRSKKAVPVKGRITQSRPRVKNPDGTESRGRVTTLHYGNKTKTFENKREATKWAKENNISL